MSMQLLRAGLLLAACIVPIHAANIVVNGSFELPDIPTGSFQLLSAIPGWTLASGASIEIQDHVAGSPFDGNQLLELDSNGNSSVYQDLATVPGAYTLSFAYSARPGVAVNTMNVFWNGSLLDTLNASGTGLADTSWVVHTYNVAATGATTRLQFTGLGPSDSLGEYVDAVAVDNPVPEPASFALLLSGVALFGARRLRPRPTRP